MYGVTKKYLRWIENFLKGRFQKVFLNDVYSYSTPVVSGVSQGSVLGPLLFIIFTNDLPSVINDAKIYTFADDTTIVTKIANQNDTKIMQRNLDKVVKWSTKNNMKLNSNKFELLSYKVKTNKENLKLLESLPFFNEYTSYRASETVDILPSQNVRDLGIIVDENLIWKAHLQQMSKTCRKLYAWVFSVFYARDKCTMLTLFNCLIRTKLEFSCEIWNPHQIQDINVIERIQRLFTNKINGMRSLNYWERLKSLNIMSLQRRRERTIILHLWKVLHNVYPNSIGIEFKEHRRSSAIRATLKPLPKIRGKVMTAFEESFVIKSAKLWNVLPPNLTHIQSLNLFKHNLDKFLIKIPDKPPLPGYPYTCNNSITSHCLCLS